MYEDVSSRRADEAEAFLVVKPLYCALGTHRMRSLVVRVGATMNVLPDCFVVARILRTGCDPLGHHSQEKTTSNSGRQLHDAVALYQGSTEILARTDGGVNLKTHKSVCAKLVHASGNAVQDPPRRPRRRVPARECEQLSVFAT